MSDSIERFSSRVDNYAKYRPGYPLEIVNLLSVACGLTPESVVADVGSGTGILSALFLQNGFQVYAVEPNQAMRAAAELLLKYPRFTSIAGAAEDTTLTARSVDLVIAAQAFHWFDQTKARDEFRRILRPDGWVGLIWNQRRLATSDFLRDLEELLITVGTDYQQVRHENVYEDIPAFFGANQFRVASFENLQYLDHEALKGRICSASYLPQPGQPNFEMMMDRLAAIFKNHEKDGKVIIEYDAKVYYGQLIH